MFFSFLLLISGIHGTATVSGCDDCRRLPIVVTFVESCDQSCAEDVLETANATYANTVYNYSVSNTAVLKTLPEDDSWDLIVQSEDVSSVECYQCQINKLKSVEFVCGSDGVSYWSPEFLECSANACLEDGDEPVTVAKQGSCKAELHCVNCPNRKMPVYITYMATCDEDCIKETLDSVNAMDYEIDADYHKAKLNVDLSDNNWDVFLEKEPVMRARCDDECLRITTGIEEIDDNPLCGSDGNTYANQRDLDCATGNWCPGEEPVTIEKYGACNTEDSSSASSFLAATTLAGIGLIVVTIIACSGCAFYFRSVILPTL